MIKKKTTTKFNFADKFTELEKIAESFEEESVDLEDGLVKFERGLKLAEELKQKLGEVENRVETIKKKFSNIESEEKSEE
ncbi:MAG: exodeoxyribonuclease VII small subunit [Patescibacteria group bacterium]